MHGFQHIKRTASRHLPPCACMCVRGCASLILEKAGSDWPKNRMFSSRAFPRHTFLPPPPRRPPVSPLLRCRLFTSVCLPIIYVAVVGNYFALGEEKHNLVREVRPFCCSPLLTLPSSSSMTRRHTCPQPWGSIVREVCKVCHF